MGEHMLTSVDYGLWKNGFYSANLFVLLFAKGSNTTACHVIMRIRKSWWRQFTKNANLHPDTPERLFLCYPVLSPFAWTKPFPQDNRQITASLLVSGPVAPTVNTALMNESFHRGCNQLNNQPAKITTRTYPEVKSVSEVQLGGEGTAKGWTRRRVQLVDGLSQSRARGSDRECL